MKNELEMEVEREGKWSSFEVPRNLELNVDRVCQHQDDPSPREQILGSHQLWPWISGFEACPSKNRRLPLDNLQLRQIHPKMPDKHHEQKE